MAKQKKTKVTEAEAAELHSLTVEIMALQARQMLLMGEVDNAAVRNSLTYLKQMGISVDPTEDKATLSLLRTLIEINLEDSDDAPSYRW